MKSWKPEPSLLFTNTARYFLSPFQVPSGSVQNLTAAIYSSTTVVVSWDPPLEPNGQPYYLITLQEAGVPPDISGQGTPAANKTIKQTTTDNVVLFTKLRKYFPYVVTVIPATSAGAAYNHTSTLNLRTDEDSKLTDHDREIRVCLTG